MLLKLLKHGETEVWAEIILNSDKNNAMRIQCKKIILSLSSTDPNLPSQPEAPIPVIYVNLGNDSIKAVTKNLTWEDARKNCEGEKASLVSLRNDWTQAYVELLTMSLKSPVWIGLNKELVRDRTGQYAVHNTTQITTLRHNQVVLCAKKK